MTDINRYKSLIDHANRYLLTARAQGITEDVIKSYLAPDYNRPQDLNELYRRILGSAQNRNMVHNVIGGVDQLQEVLLNFDPHAVLNKYYEDPNALLPDIEKALQKPRGSLRRGQRSIWPHFCRTIISAAIFVSQFPDIESFIGWANKFAQDPKSYAALPLIISEEIEGIGFALACDFLKEIGFTNYAKPDVHVKKISIALKFANDNDGDYKILKRVQVIATNCGKSPYHVDKLLWLCGSGKFYKHRQLGNNGKIKTINRKGFIKFAKPLRQRKVPIATKKRALKSKSARR